MAFRAGQSRSSNSSAGRLSAGVVAAGLLSSGLIEWSLGYPVPAATAGARSAAYSIHMLARIPSRCVIRDVSRILILTREDAYGETGPLHGTARFRVECNVPYVLETASIQPRHRPRARLIPLSAVVDPPSLPVAPEELPGASPEPATELRCYLSGAGADKEDCPSHAAAALSPVLPRATAKLHVAQPDAQIDSEQRSLESVAGHVEYDVVTIEIGSRL